ncbi:MAG: chaperone modulator CbpM [Sulfitobacter sp.]
MKLDEKQVVATVHRLQLRDLRLWVSEGWVRPAISEHGPVFDELDVARIRLVCDLNKDLSLPRDAVPVVLSLLDQVHGLRRELRDLADAVDRQPDATRKAIVATYRKRTPP